MTPAKPTLEAPSRVRWLLLLAIQYPSAHANVKAGPAARSYLCDRRAAAEALTKPASVGAPVAPAHATPSP
jgi:hypothetical protein